MDAETPIESDLRDAADHPERHDLPALLWTAADEIDRLVAELRAAEECRDHYRSEADSAQYELARGLRR